jgi:hypothetical protein
MALRSLVPSQDDLLRASQPGTLPSVFGGLKPLNAAASGPPVPVNMPQGAPQLPTLRPLPMVTNPRKQLEDSLQQQITAHEMPGPQKGGFWHKLGRIAAGIGNAVGNTLVPGAMVNIPGTELHNALDYALKQRELAGLEKQDTEEQDAAQRRALEAAQTEKLSTEAALQPEMMNQEMALRNAQIANLLHPQAKSEFQLWQQQNPDKPIEEWLKLQKSYKPEKELSAENDLKNQILDAEQKGDTATVKKLQKQLEDLNPFGQQRIAISLGNEGRKQDMQVRQTVFKVYQPALDSSERFNVMTKNYEDAIKNHDQQAMLSLLANHLGMTMGLQKGARLTRDIIREAQESRPWLQGLEAKFDKNGYLQGVNLTPEQMRQMVNLGRERFYEDVRKAKNEASYLGAEDEGPKREPNKATMRMYLGLAGGDVNKAKQMAEEDGWTVK